MAKLQREDSTLLDTPVHSTRPQADTDYEAAPRYVCFMRVENNQRGTISFCSYKDARDKPVLHPHTKTDRHGNLIPAHILIEGFWFHVNADDAELLKFVRESPMCEGSLLQRQGQFPPTYYEVNEQKAAENHVDETLAYVNAINAIMALLPAQQEELALSIGCFAESKAKRLDACYRFATGNPNAMLEKIKNINGDTKLLAAFEWALNQPQGLFKYDPNRDIYLHGAEVLANSKDRALAAIKQDAMLYKYLMDAFKAKTR